MLEKLLKGFKKVDRHLDETALVYATTITGIGWYAWAMDGLANNGQIFEAIKNYFLT